MMSNKQIRNKIFKCVTDINHDINISPDRFICHTCNYIATKKQGMIWELKPHVTYEDIFK